MKDFEIVAHLGRGAFGSIKLASNIYTGKKVAIKIYREEVNREGIEVSTRLAMTINHPNLMNCIRYFEDVILDEKNIERKCFCTELEYVSGINLQRMVRGAFKDNKICQMPQKMDIYFPQMISALSYLHRNKIVHRDFKPSNIVVDDDNNIKLVDYDFLGKCTKKLKTKCGTPYYNSPEIFAGEEYDERTDIWSLGVTIYFSLTYKQPFDAENEKEYTKLILENTHNPDYSNIPIKYISIINGFLRKAEERISLVDALEKFERF